MSDNRDLDNLLGQEVVVRMESGREVVGTLDSYDDDFSITLTGSGTPDNPTLGEMSTEYVDGKEVFNGSNVESVNDTS